MVLEDEGQCLSIGFTEANFLSCSFDKDDEKVSYDLCEMPTDYIKKTKNKKYKKTPKTIILCVIK